MARQATAPVSFSRSTRRDEGVLMTSGRAGVVVPAGYIPLLKGDSLSGVVSLDFNLAEMPKPLLNPAYANVQAWFVPKASYPQFAGTDEFLNAYTGTSIRALGAVDRTPPPYFHTQGVPTDAAATTFFKTLGLHIATGTTINTDLIDAFTLVYNFRLAAHSSKLPLKKYAQEDIIKACEFPPAFWPSGRFARVVPDYERALILGALDLDISAGKIPIPGITRMSPTVNGNTSANINNTSNEVMIFNSTGGTNGVKFMLDNNAATRLFADMTAEVVTTSLADIDKARTTQAFAKLRTAYAGNDTTGFMSDEMILAYLMQGISVPPEYFRRPWLLGQQRVGFGFAERHATDGASLDQSITTGRTSVRLPINVPNQDVGGYVVFTVEVLPERLDERQSDEYWRVTDPDHLPNALRDVQRVEPVDQVLNRRLDAKHTSPDGLYGYEPMNDVWNRSFTRLGGVFYQPVPTAPVTEARAGIWQAGIVDPVYNEDHFLAPSPFPHDVFSDTQAPAFELVVRHTATIVGLTQIGDVLQENNDDFAAVEDGGISDGVA